MINFDSIFSFLSEKSFEIPFKIKRLIGLRELARSENNWTLSDDLRDQIQREGWTVEDTTNGQKLKKTNY